MKRDTARWAVGSLVFHAVVVAALLIYSGPSFRFDREVRFIDLSALTETPEVDLPPMGRTGGPAEPAADRRAARPAAPAARDSAPEPAVGPPVRPSDVAEGAPGGDTTDAADPVRFGPSYESGRLWVRPLDALARASGAAPVGTGRIDNGVHVARVDSAVAAKIRAFLDTLPRDSFALPPPPDWTTEIDGKKWGIDNTWIYLGDLRLPAAVLALLPFPQGNYEQSRRAAELQRIREDILNAAWRAESAEQFKANVRALRERLDRERELRKNQQAKPDSVRT